MKKSLRKVGAVVLALAMVLSLGATAFATVNPDLGDYEGSNNKGHGVTTGSVNITKSIAIFNPENTAVREPNVQFVYAVTPVTEAAKLGNITDDGRYNDPTNDPVTVKANAGVADAITGGATIKFEEANTVAAKATGTIAQHSGTISIDASKFTHAGVYRYLITESIQDHSGNAIVPADYGIEARTTNYETTRYLDLYIINGTSGLELSSAVIFKTNSVDDSDTAATTGITVTTDKTTGFEPGTDPSGTPDYTDDEDVDRYFTYNLKVGKTTTGTLADKNNDFPFVVTLTGALTPVVKTDLTVTGATGVSNGVQNINTTALVLNPAMSDGDYIVLKGIPKGTTVSVKETNNTPDIYTASWDTPVGTSSTATVVSDNSDTTDMALANSKSATASGIAIDGNQDTAYLTTELGFTNNLAEISPTGVVLRVAPYALMLVAGLFLLFLGKKRQAYEA